MERDIKKTSVMSTSGVSRAFPMADGSELYAARNITIEIPERSLTILRGRSGSGKTTLLNMLGALDIPTCGQILFDGSDIVKYTEAEREKLRRHNFGFVFQSVSLIPVMTVYENVEFSLRLAGITERMPERVKRCLHMVGLSQRAQHMPQELSGGEQQRVAIARAFAHSPRIVFADEPTGELDTQTAINVVNIFKGLIKEENITIVMTTHDVGLMGAGDCVYTLEDGEIISG